MADWYCYYNQKLYLKSIEVNLKVEIWVHCVNSVSKD